MYKLIIKQIMGATEAFNARRRVQNAPPPPNQL